LNTLVNFQSAQPSKTGQFSIGVNSVWASIATLSGLESVRSGIELSLIRSSMRIRYRLGITSDMRVLYGADLYEIEAVLMDEQSKEHMDLICRTGAAQ
jgi:SPP1 family predicted phage head-tail adaptor